MAQPNLTLSNFPPPARLGRYLLGRELGRGFSSVVYEATDPLRGRRVALKVLTFLQNLSPSRRQDLTERFEREARAISALAHPAIVSIYEVGHADDGREFIAMELLEGETLRARLQRGGPLPTSEALPLIAQVADALHYAHGRGIIHRDVKPDNVFVCPDGTAKLMDFGVAHVFADDGQTQTGTVVGSPAYMSPEQINGRTLDGRSDVFSLAVTLAEAVTGRKPFEGPNIPAVMNQILHRPPQLAGIGSRPLRRVLERALAKNPQARTASPALFADALRRMEPAPPPAFAGSPSATMVMPLPPPLPPRPARRAPGRALGLAAAALGLTTLIALPFLLPRRPAPPEASLRAAHRSARAPAGRAYHISPEWRRAKVSHARRAESARPVILAAPPALREGEGRAVETFSPGPVTPDAADILRLLRHQPRPEPFAPPKPAALRIARRVPPAQPNPQPVFTPRPIFTPRTAATVPPPVRVAAAPVAVPVFHVSGSREERVVPTVAPPPPPPDPQADGGDGSDGYPYGDGPAPRDSGDGDSRPRLVHRAAPFYPPAARALGEQGTVRLRVFINEDGNVDDAAVTRSSGSPALDAAAIAAVLHWQYEPAMQNGQAVPATVRESVRF